MVRSVLCVPRVRAVCAGPGGCRRRRLVGAASCACWALAWAGMACSLVGHHRGAPAAAARSVQDGLDLVCEHARAAQALQLKWSTGDGGTEASTR